MPSKASRRPPRARSRRAGITQPLLHHYFGSKDALFDEVLEAAVADYVAAQSRQWKRPMDDLGFWTMGLPVLFRWLGEQPTLGELVMLARLEGRDGINEGTFLTTGRRKKGETRV